MKSKTKLSKSSEKTLAQLFKFSHFPKSLKTAKIISILKAGKNPQLGSSYRPISLLSGLSKISRNSYILGLTKFF